MLIKSLIEAAGVLSPPSKIIKLGSVEVELKAATVMQLAKLVSTLGDTLGEAVADPGRFTAANTTLEALRFFGTLEATTADRILCVMLDEPYEPGQSLPPIFAAEIVKGWWELNGESLKKTVAVFSAPEKAVASSSRGRRKQTITP